MVKKSKESEGLLERGKQKTLKTLSKILQVFTIIARVCLIIGVVAVAITAVVTPLIMKDVTINREEISYKSHKIELKENGDEIDLYYKDKKLGDIDDIDKDVINELLDHYDAKRLTAIFETALMASIIIMILYSIVLGYAANILKNINEKDTPFIEENAQLFKKAAYFMIAIIAVSAVCAGILAFISSGNFNLSLDFIDIGEILFIFILSYIFEYGCKLQEKADFKIYDE